MYTCYKYYLHVNVTRNTLILSSALRWLEWEWKNCFKAGHTIPIGT